MLTTTPHMETQPTTEQKVNHTHANATEINKYKDDQDTNTRP